MFHSSDDNVTRRGLLGSILALGVGVQATADKDEVEPASAFWGTQPGGLPELKSEIWTDRQWASLRDKPEDVQKLEGLGWIRLREVPRSESLADDPTPQPTPISEEVIGSKVVVRHWEPEAIAHCRLCARCTATPTRDRADVMVCQVLLPEIS